MEQLPARNLQKHIKQTIKAEANYLGFSLVGITSPDTPNHFDVYKNWLIADYHAGMKYLEREDSIQKRQKPLLLMPECRSIICLAYPYPNAKLLSAKSDGIFGRVASYAWKRDYHHDLPAKMGELIERVEKQLDIRIKFLAFTDSAPILERDLASRAGLGWIGKNGCLINQSIGSYFFLCELFVDLDLSSDKLIITDHCGKCDRCLKACPTGCILPDRTIDSNLCISYLTIENKDIVPKNLRSQMGNWIFGCDICQMVCPWNRIKPEMEQQSLGEQSDGDAGIINIVQEMEISEADFREKYGSSPVMRTKRKGYLRNMAVALGNSHSPLAIRCLVDALETETDPLIRSHCIWALGQISGENALLALKQALLKERDPMVIQEIKQIIG